MSDKTTEQAAEEYANDIFSELSPNNRNRGLIANCAKTDFMQGANFKEAELSTTIAELQKENERLREALQILKQQAANADECLYAPDVLALSSKALTPNNTK